ncbi:uncharacterized protein LOC108671005 [Hyalella azteca]|uniref:N-acetylgalactosaminide beta-1,3-galactosyltransferase n=1 Tax=Hyalella azteca TaxID=294128 RepID=A0A8B7NK04_HYAAZ|nr:uncharacterized protein LOC108671005 [Hyalella azteca]
MRLNLVMRVTFIFLTGVVVTGVLLLLLPGFFRISTELKPNSQSQVFSNSAFNSLNVDYDSKESLPPGTLHQKIRILCLVVSHPGQHTTQAKAVHFTWSQRCTQTFFITNLEPLTTDDDYLSAVCGILAVAGNIGDKLQQFKAEYCVQDDTTTPSAESTSSLSPSESPVPDMRDYPEWVEWFTPSLPMLFVPQTDPGRLGLWNKTKFAYLHAYQHFLTDFDWFLKADDDTYFIMENLRSLLQLHEPTEPVYFGCNFRKTDNLGYMSGGAGYVLSRAALEAFAAVVQANASLLDNTWPEDLNMGLTLEEAGVTPGESRDVEGRPRFFPLSARSLAHPQDGSVPDWYWQLTAYAHHTGPQCCSPSAISFHYMTDADMYFTELLLYNVRLSRV